MDRRALDLVGRADELQKCRAFLDACWSGTLGQLVITGDQGIGKTSLLATVLAQAGPDIDLVTLSGDPGRSGIAFGIVADAFELGPVAAEPEAVRDRIVDALEERAVTRPLVIAVDDAQWVDDETLHTLRLASLRLRDLPVAIIATVRGTIDHPAITAIRADHERPPLEETVCLTPLTSVEVEQLVRLRCGSHFDNALQSAQHAAGNPLLVNEFVDAAMGGDATRASTPAPPDTRSIDAALREAATERLDRQPAAQRALLVQLAILGTTFPTADALAVMERPRAEALKQLEELLATGMLTDADEAGFRFHHPSAYSAAYESEPKGLRCQRHLAAAHALAAAGRPATAIAYQIDAAGTDLGTEDVELVLEVVQAIGARQPDLAVRLLERALALRAPSTTHERLVVAMLDALLAAGRPKDVEALAQRELSHSPGADHRFEVVRRRYAALGTLGQHAERRTLIEAALRRHDLTARERAWSRFYLLEAFWVLGESMPSRLIEEALADARDLGDTSLLARSLGPVAWAAMTAGEVDGCVAYAREAQRSIARSGVWVHGLGIYIGSALVAADLFDEVRQVHIDVREAEYRLGVISDVVPDHIGYASTDYAQGRLSNGRAEVAAAFQAIAEGSAALVTPIFGHGYGALLAAQAGATEEFQHHVDCADALLAEGHPPFGINYLALARVYDALATGDPKEAFGVLRRAWDATATRGFTRPWREALPVLTKLSVSEGQLVEADAYAATAETGAAKAPGILSATATALRCRGIVDGDAAAVTRAGDELLRAGRTLEAGCAFEDAAAVALRNVRTGQANSLAERAREIFGSLGADGGLQRLERLFSEGPSHRRRTRPTSGWASVTPSELAVIELVAAGDSNPKVAAALHLSRHTVESHLKRVYMKLGISSRAALATAYANRP